MNLLEHQAKTLLKRSGIMTPHSTLVSCSNIPKTAPFLPVVIKSQVPIGGRGKLGGVKIATTPQEFTEYCKKITNTTIHGYTPDSLLLEEVIAIDREFYLSLAIDRGAASLLVTAHTSGGVDIESHSSNSFFTGSINKATLKKRSFEIAEYLSIPDKEFVLEDILTSLLQCFIDNDCTLLEINPLILTKNGQLIAGDAKIILDDQAAFRHPEWSHYPEILSNNFVVLDKNARIATMANGAGLAMATVDSLTRADLTPANFLDIGGSATPEHIAHCFEQIIKLLHIDAIVVNIFGGIVRCDTVAQSVVAAQQTIQTLPKLYIRLNGTNEAMAKNILAEHNITLYSTIDDIITTLGKSDEII